MVESRSENVLGEQFCRVVWQGHTAGGEVSLLVGAKLAEMI